MSQELITICNVRGFVDPTGTAQLSLEDVARGLGFTREAASGNQVVRWERVDGYLKEFGVPTCGHDGFIPENIFYKLAFKAKNETAQKFQSLVCDEILPTIRKTGHYETPEYKLALETKEELLGMKQLLLDSGILRTCVNPRYTFERLNVRYKIATGDDSRRGIHEAIGDYFCFIVPFSAELKSTTLRDWLIEKVGIEEIQQFIVGIESGMIVKSIRGHWVNLNGYGSNNVEWPKVLREFGNSCAYCGRSDVTLIPEHVIPQYYLAQSNPEAVDLVGNIVPSCGICNHSKGKSNVDEWFEQQTFYSSYRIERIHQHQAKYRVEVV